MPQVMNIPRIRRTENLGTFSDRKFPEYSHCDHNFAIAPQTTLLFFKSKSVFAILDNVEK